MYVKKSKPLSSFPTLLRSGVAKGIASATLPAVDETGGDFGAGLIRGFAVVSRGEALGHGLWIDNQFVQQTSDAINAEDAGSKSRFTHPNLSGDGMAKFLGRTKNGSVDGDVARADQHLAATAHNTPDGDLAGYVMARASEDPASFGASISFDHDCDAELAFLTANGFKMPEDPDDFDGDFGAAGFVSPDPLNVDNLPHARLKELRAVDVVDDPACNPNGLFHRGDELAAEANDFAAYALGLSKKKPAMANFDIDPDRAAGFVQRFLGQRGLSLTPIKPKEFSIMPTAQTPGAGAPAPKTDPPAETSLAAAGAPPAAPVAKTGADYLSAFGDKGGVWFAQGKSFEEAQSLFTADLKASNEALTAKNSELAAQVRAGRGEATPLGFQGEKTKEELAEQSKREKYNGKLPDNLGRVAAGIVFRKDRQPASKN